MLGLIQKVLFDLIADLGGQEAVLKVKEHADVPADKIYLIGTNYSDEEWQRISKAALEILKLTPDQLDETYANAFCNYVLKQFPVWFTISKNSYQFLARQPKIHSILAKSVIDKKTRESIGDKFRVEQLENKFIAHYKSPNQCCGLYKAAATWIINYYNDKATINETQCMKSGAPECEIHIQWQLLTNQE